MKRLYKPRDFSRLLGDLMSSAEDIRALPEGERLSRQFTERIMLAVTEVNGCRYCSYFHSRVSLRAGMKKEEIRRIMAGDFEGAPQEELAGLYFAQHYADSGGKPSPDAVDCLADAYGKQKSRAIIAAIRAIMIGNAWGNMFDAFRLRMSGDAVQGQTIWDELGVIFGPMVMIPANFIGRLFKGRSRALISAD